MPAGSPQVSAVGRGDAAMRSGAPSETGAPATGPGAEAGPARWAKRVWPEIRPAAKTRAVVTPARRRGRATARRLDGDGGIAIGTHEVGRLFCGCVPAPD